jgi:hypothetical protein
LAEQRSRFAGRGSRGEAEPSEQVARFVAVTGSVEPAHRPTAAGASIEVRLEHMPEQPRPTFSQSWLVGVGDDIELELELIARSGRRRGGIGISGRVRDHFSAEP